MGAVSYGDLRQSFARRGPVNDQQTPVVIGDDRSVAGGRNGYVMGSTGNANAIHNPIVPRRNYEHSMGPVVGYPQMPAVGSEGQMVGLVAQRTALQVLATPGVDVQGTVPVRDPQLSLRREQKVVGATTR